MISKKRPNREKHLVVITATVIAISIIYAVAVNPQLRRRKTIVHNMAELELRLAKIKRDTLIKDQIDGLYRKVEPLIAGTGSEQQDLSMFAGQLAKLYSELDLKIRSVKILPDLDENFYKRLSIKIELLGNARNVINFITRIETCDNPIKIEQLIIKAQEPAGYIQATFVISKIIAKPMARI